MRVMFSKERPSKEQSIITHPHHPSSHVLLLLCMYSYEYRRFRMQKNRKNSIFRAYEYSPPLVDNPLIFSMKIARKIPPRNNSVVVLRCTRIKGQRSKAPHSRSRIVQHRRGERDTHWLLLLFCRGWGLLLLLLCLYPPAAAKPHSPKEEKSTRRQILVLLSLLTAVVVLLW